MDTIKRISLIFTIIFCTNIYAQNNFVIWQGFEHTWKYNHRLNRLGDYIAQSSSSSSNDKHIYSSVHASASGVGKDTATFKTNFAEITNTNINCFSGKLSISLNGKQGELCSVSRVILLPKNIINKWSETAVVFNGFDLISESGADKLQMIKINFSDVMPSKYKDTMQVKVDIDLVVDCKSFECNRFYKKFEYTINLYYLILGADQYQMHTTSEDYNQTIAWSKKETTPKYVLHKEIKGDYKYSQGILTFKSICVVLNSEHWLLSYANAIEACNYNKNSGLMQFNHRSYLQQYENEMNKASTQAKFSSKQKGWALLQGTIQLIQFKKGEIVHKNRTDYIFWKGMNKKAHSDLSKNIKTYTIQNK
ncbi:MAG: hypothetical protein H6553_10585 [Chitinophagales bacterium]|nr:hypothetical protein [Chitinophagales bacterium]